MAGTSWPRTGDAPRAPVADHQWIDHGRAGLRRILVGRGAVAPGFGPTTEQWQVSFGSQTQYTPIVSNASEGFTGWQYETMNFTASGGAICSRSWRWERRRENPPSRCWMVSMRKFQSRLRS